MLVRHCAKFTVTLVLATLLGGAMWGQEQQQKSPWKDRAEYDLYNSIVQEKDLTKKLQLLDSYSEKYPESNFKENILLMYVQTYQGLKQADKMYDAALKLLEMNPKNFQGIYFMVSLTASMQKTDPEFLARGEKYSKQLLEQVEQLPKPANLSDADWKKQTDTLRVLGHQTLGWIAMTRKDNATAESEFRKVLQINPNNGQVSYYLGTVIIAQRDPAKQSEAFYHFARASAYDGEGKMPEPGRQQVDSYLRKIYTSFHGDESGLDEIYAMAKTQPFPPADFKVKSKEQIEIEKAEELKRTNPKLALWLNIKDQLLASNGQEYFESSVRNTAMPGLRGYLIAQSPQQRPDTLVLGLSDRSTREVTLKLDTAFRYPAPGGTVINFQCVPRTFTAQPFNLSFDCEQANISGWPPPPSRRPAVR